MRIGIDARELCGHATGAGRYLGGLLAEWGAHDRARGHEFVLYAPDPLSLCLDARRFPTRLVPGRPGTWWEQVRLPRVAARDHLDVFFAPAYTAPLALDVPLVVAIHDLSFFAHPEWFRTREGIRRRWLTRRAALRARAVLTISEFSRGELIDRLDVPGRTASRDPAGCGAGPMAASADSSKPRVLFVGSIFNRRHVPDLIRAFGAVARSHPDASLDIVGDNRSYPHEDVARTIRTEGLAGRVRWHSYVADSELRALYGRARAFAFLSEYEGLGLTPLEALAAGVPPVLLDTPVARESCGDAALYVPVGRPRCDCHCARARALRPGRARSTCWPPRRRCSPATLAARRARHAGRDRGERRLTPFRSSSSASTRAPISSAASRRSTPPRPSVPHEIIVVDNASSDGSADAARRWPGVIVVDAGANLGFAAASNLGIRASTGAYLLLLNSDTIVPPQALDRLLDRLNERPDAAVAGPSARGRRGTRRALLRPHDRPAQRAQAETARHRPRAARAKDLRVRRASHATGAHARIG